MAFLGIDFSGVSGWFSSAGSNIGTALLILFIVLVVGGFTFWIYYNRLQKKQYIATVNLFKVVNGKKFWIAADKAKEVVIPGTNVRLFFWKTRKLWSAYPTRSIGFNVYSYAINRMGELTNFDLGEGEDEFEARIDYDHRDQTYAYLNLQEFVNRNYKQREKVAWWKEHIGLISAIVILALFGLEMWYFFSQSGHQLQQWTQISNSLKDASNVIAQAVTQAGHLGSGVTGG